MIAIYCAVFIQLKWLRPIKWFDNDDCVAFSSSKLRCNTSQKLLPGSFIMCSSYESSIPATTFILFHGYELPFTIMHHLKAGIKLNKMTHCMLKYLEGQKSYEFLTDFVFATSLEIGGKLKLVICSSYMNRFR